MPTKTNARPSNETELSTSVADEISTLKEDIARLTDDVKGVGSAMVEKGREVATAKYEDTTEKLSSTLDTCTRAVEQRPITSVLVALGAGVVIGKFLLDRRG